MSFMRCSLDPLEGVARLGVLREVEPDLLVLFGYADAAAQPGLQREPDEAGDDKRERKHEGPREHLLTEKSPPAAEEHAVGSRRIDRRVGEQAQQHRAD